MANPKVRIRSLMLADEVVADPVSQKVNVTGMFSQVTIRDADRGKARLEKFSLVVEGILKDAPATEELFYDLKVEIHHADNGRIGGTSVIRTRVAKGSDGFRSILNFGPTELGGEGVYSAKVYVDGEFAHEEPFFLRVKKSS